MEPTRAQSKLARFADDFFNQLIHKTKYPYKVSPRNRKGQYKAVHRSTQPHDIRFIQVTYMGQVTDYIKV